MIEDESKKIRKEEKDLEISKADLERLEILQRSNEKIGRQLSINSETGNL
ncbi:hypothetical protein [Flavobacterium salmonis]|uniref:Uncharacterized protein n=1 Tax=Flavobacterium salmonis TaxID=2654844 RepID=A0A6V6YYC9_9FLAO|nr:hypothetical protein [Flavobacterium salmonis]CAD0004538.1 hypothetical protein FLAT13_02327 [Flavobacterium salmonis]